MSSTEQRSTGLRGAPLNERLQVLLLLMLTAVTAGLAVIVLIGLGGDDSGPADGEDLSAAAAEEDADEESADSDATTGTDDGSPPRVVFIGDEWAAGAGATDPDQAFTSLAAAELGWTLDVDSVAGSGWTKDAPQVPGSRFVDRAARLSAGDNAPDVVVVSAQTPSGSPLAEVADLISQTVDTIRTQVPEAVTVVVLPVANNQADLLCPPVADDLVCIDTFTEGWLIPGARGSLMNASESAPNDAGHARLAEFLVEDLRAALPDLAS